MLTILLKELWRKELRVHKLLCGVGLDGLVLPPPLVDTAKGLLMPPPPPPLINLRPKIWVLSLYQVRSNLLIESPYSRVSTGTKRNSGP